MWIRRGKQIINTDNVCAIKEEKGHLFFRLSGASNPSTIDRAAMSCEIMMKNIPAGTIDIIWHGIQENRSIITL
mgnify:FL=1